jgi:uncharacterized protein YjbI with pentapeptide repeats
LEQEIGSRSHKARSFGAGAWYDQLAGIAAAALALLAATARLAQAQDGVEAGSRWWAQPGWEAAIALAAAAALFGTILIARRRRGLRLEQEAASRRFDNLLKQFAGQGDPRKRVKAALRLARAARIPLHQTQAEPKRENYPFFGLAARCLGAALEEEAQEDVRAGIAKGLTQMCEFGSRCDQTLLHCVIEEVARPNRNCKEALTRALGEYCLLRRDAIRDTDEQLWPLLSSAPLCTHEAATMAAFRDFAAAGSNQAERMVSGQAETTGEELIREIRGCVARLKDSRAVLSEALRRLGGPSGIPSDPEELRAWTCDPAPPDLRGCCLSGADLQTCRLPGVDLQDAELQGAQLGSVSLQRATLSGAHMEWADLEEAYLAGASLENAHLENADLSHAHLRGAKLSGAHLQGANLRRADLRDARLDGANLQATDLISSRLEGASLIRAGLEGAHLYKATVDEGEGESHRVAYFTGANWWEAEFTHPRSGRLDRNLVAWLTKRFPKSDDRT